MKKIKVAIIGHFGGKELFSDGQTVKTKTLYETLASSTDWKIGKVDTFYKKKRPVSLMLKTLWALVSNKNIIVLLSGNGMKFYFPLLYFSAKVFKRRIYHDVIGGNLDTYIKQNAKFVKYLNSFKTNWVETNSLKEKIENYGVINCEVIPNFKHLDILSENEISVSENGVFKFCTFSRVMKEKGIEDAIDAITKINKEAEKTICVLDIYGQIDEKYKPRFSEVMINAEPAIKYKGVVPFSRSVETIKVYDALLFPTYWYGEGFPGTIIDAYSAGLPVIATDWNCNPELIENGKTGTLYSKDEPNALKTSIEKFMEYNAETHLMMRKNCLESAKQYSSDKWVEVIKSELN